MADMSSTVFSGSDDLAHNGATYPISMPIVVTANGLPICFGLTTYIENEVPQPHPAVAKGL